MKKIKVITAFACVLCSLVSCSSDDAENLSDYSGNAETIKVGYIDANGNIANSGETMNQVLCFGSESKYDEFVQKVKKLSAEEKNKIFSDLGFTNLNEIAVIADKELDSIGDNSSSEAEFKSKYESYLNKYADVLVTNDVDTSDLSLYVPASSDEDVNPYLVGAKKMVVVNGNVRKLDFSNEMNSADKNLFASKSESQIVNINNGRKKASSRDDFASDIREVGKNSVATRMDNSIKIVFDASVRERYPNNARWLSAAQLFTFKELMFHFAAQKKMWYGWKRTERVIYFKPGAFYGCKGVSYIGNVSYNGYKMIGAGKLKTVKDQFGKPYKTYEYFGFAKLSTSEGKYDGLGKEDFGVGVVDFDNQGRYHVTGTVYVWIMCHDEVHTSEYMENYDWANKPCVKINVDRSGKFEVLR